MFEVLAAYLKTVVSPEMRDAILSACELLVSLGVEGHVFAIDQELEMADHVDTTVAVSSIYAAVIETTRAVLEELGVTVKDNMPLHIVGDLLNSLQLLTNYDDQVAITDILDTSSDPVEALSTVVALVGTYPSHDYLDVIADVSNDLLIRLRTLNDDQESFDALPDPEVVARSRTRFKAFIKGTSKSLIETAIRGGARLGVLPDDLIDQIADPLHDLTAKGLGAELAGAFLASGTPDDKLIEETQAMINKFSADITFVSQASQTATRLLTEAMA